MSLIKNLVKDTEENKSRRKKKNGEEESNNDEKDKPLGPFIKSATDLQRLKLEKLMKNPEKPVIIPEQRRERDYMSSVPTFVRNVMGSSAGAGSGEFHVYRHLRRKEYARQKNIQNQSLREAADMVYQQKLEDNKQAAEARTAKKRAKRLKKKLRAKRARDQKPNDQKKVESESSDSASEDDAETKSEADTESKVKEEATTATAAAEAPHTNEERETVVDAPAEVINKEIVATAEADTESSQAD